MEQFFQPGDWVVHSHFGLGKILELLEIDEGVAARIEFAHAAVKVIALKYARMRPATDLEVASPYLQPDFHEPYTLAQSLLDQLEIAVSSWENALDWIRNGERELEDYQDDLSERGLVDDLLAACQDGGYPVPDDLAGRIVEADRELIELTVDSNCCALGNDPALYNKERHWYYFRWLPNLLNDRGDQE